MSTNILVIDDDEHIVRMMRRVLRVAHHDVTAACDGPRGLDLASRLDPDLIILDIMMPGPDGFRVCEQLRRRTKAPILMLTALAATDHQVQGLDAGADDYLVKPFAAEVLQARVRALLRRTSAYTGLLVAPPLTLRYADLSLDTGTHDVSRAERPISLSTTEFRLLRLFLEHPEQVLSREQLMAAVWSSEFSGTSNVLAVQICSLRDKLEQGGNARLIHTLRGSGYILRQQERTPRRGP